MLSILLLAFMVDGPAPKQDAAALAARIDFHIDEVLKNEKVTAEKQSDDAEFHRRLYLDLLGRIPTEKEVRAFLDDKNPSKRNVLITKLLRDPRHADHFARTWRMILLPEAETDRQVDYFRPGFEAWFREKREKNVGMDVIVRDLLTVRIAGPNDMPEIVLRQLRKPSVLGFYAAKEIKPENIASSVTRVFMGIRIECAQCHNHPFGHWTQNQFWNQAAFFAGLQRRGGTMFSPIIEVPTIQEIKSTDSKITEKAVFLDKSKPPQSSTVSARISLGKWMTSPANKQFSLAMVNRIWAQLMGVGIVEPVDDFNESNRPSHPKLLEELAETFTRTGYNLDLLMSAICQSKAYQRTSRQTNATPTDLRLYHRMAIKQLSGEQFVNSLWFALGKPLEDPYRIGGDRDRFAMKLREMFQNSDRYSDPQTSILQALTLRNDSRFNDMVADLRVLREAEKANYTSDANEQTAENGAGGKMGDAMPGSGKMSAANDSMQPDGAPEEKPKAKPMLPPLKISRNGKAIETLYLSTLSRMPTEAEMLRHLHHVQSYHGKDDHNPMTDVLWALLNSMEFRCNH